MSKPVCLVTGVGLGTGAAMTRRFAAGGYQIAMLARDPERLEALEREIEGTKAYPCDVGDLDALKSTVEAVRRDLGEPAVLIHNAVRGTVGGFMEAAPENLEQNFRVNTTALLYLGRELAPAMIAAGSGAILVTGNTAAFRGRPYFSLYAPTKAAQRILAEAMARELGPKGVHVAYLMIDAGIDAPWTRERIYPGKPDEFFAKPAAIAEEAYRVAHQDRSTWSFLVELRPFGEVW